MRLLFGLFLLIFISQTARADIGKMIEFRTDLAPESTLKLPPKSWTQSERDFVTGLFQSLETKSPELLARAAQAGKIMLYRADTTPDHPSAGWIRRRHESSFIFADLFFQAKRPKDLAYVKWVFIHEISHLADPVDQIARSAKWSDIIAPRLSSVEAVLKKEGLTMRQAMFKRLDAKATPFGFTGIYGATSRHEAMAEFAAAYYFGKPVPKDVEDFLRAKIFTNPDPQIKELTKHYRRANIHFRKKEYGRAITSLDGAVALSPEFSQGYYLRGFVYANSGEQKKAIKDYSEALKLVPQDDRKVRKELLAARKWSRQRLKN